MLKTEADLRGGTTRWVKEDQRAISLLGWGLLHRLARFLNIVAQEEIEEPMWADLSVCDSTNDETDDSWFNISHEFHQCSSRQLISIVLGPANLINIQEPTSPKLPASVTKSRGKNYKIKQWEQRKGKAIPNKQHPVKTFVLNLLLNRFALLFNKARDKTARVCDYYVKTSLVVCWEVAGKVLCSRWLKEMSWNNFWLCCGNRFSMATTTSGCGK
ncbi:uncharacterized protein LOC110897824 isoform X2 [Helianthus annuus]|uniref:uncharacterized protein LOC110897824 isoform X2 n=1 Tax=Helianthus annuus TaxID=4232 RepID=UPI00165314AA|nr:uncharacterized protein LOC110897824 isoform X2 [Helianthus annuus]